MIKNLSIIAAGTIIIGGVILFAHHRSKIEIVPAGDRAYHDAEYQFSLDYPADLNLNKTDEGGGASTLTFESADGTKGFEIFVVPYAESSVSDDRFHHDEPSGVRNNLATTSIDGEVVSTFNGFNFALGDTYEAWFIHGGYLFEIATTKDLEAWLREILKTLTFTK